MPFLLAIKGFALTAIGKYVMIGVAGFVALLWLRHEFRGPLQATIHAMHKASADKERIAGEDRRRADANAARAEELQSELDRIVAETKAGACRLSQLEIDRLRRLSAAK